MWAREQAYEPTPPAPFQAPSRQAFHSAVAAASGAAGFDGVTAHEAKALQAHFPTIIDELYDLWSATTHAAATPDGLGDELVALLWSWRVAGIPKKSPFASRPISVGSVLARAWHKTLLKVLPAPPTGQWCGVQETSVVSATASLLAESPTAMAEFDLSKAFDHLWPELAAAALAHSGAPCQVTQLLLAAWRGPRVCSVAGQLAEPIFPTRGVPQGDPCSPLALAAVLGLWSAAVGWEDPGLRTWAYMDDRTLALVENTPHSVLHDAIRRTTAFDVAVGFENNGDKEQTWFSRPENSDPPRVPRAEDPLGAPQGQPNQQQPQQQQRQQHPSSEGRPPIEHLGLRLHPGDPTVPITPRYGYDRIVDTIARLARCPGGMEMRTRLAAAYVRPLLDWAAPFLRSPPASITTALFDAIHQTRCTWWCRARWWAARIGIHPQFGVAIRGLLAAQGILQWPSQHLSEAIRSHAATLNLNVVAITTTTVTLEAAATASEHVKDHLVRTYGSQAQFTTQDQRAAHTLRTAARTALLATTSRRRYDREGITEADVEACSSTTWTKWLNKLDKRDRLALQIWRGGAVRTTTRLHWRPAQDPHSETNSRCPWCSAEAASARHLFAECPRFAKLRLRLETEHQIPPHWWAAQPRCTSKTGWITHSAARCAHRRAQLQTAACTLGIAITHACAPPHDGGAPRPAPTIQPAACPPGIAITHACAPSHCGGAPQPAPTAPT